MTPAQVRRIERRVTTRQIGGDDGYCWCVLIDGHIKWDGMQRGEAQWRAKSERAALCELAEIAERQAIDTRPAQQRCMWFEACENPATTVRSHPAFGSVHICQRCDDKVARLEAKTRPFLGWVT